MGVRHGCVLLKKIIFSSLLLSTLGCVESEQRVGLPVTSEELGQYLEASRGKILETINDLVAVPDDQKTTENILRPWSRLSNDILANFRVLTFLAQIGFPSKEDAQKGIEDLQMFLMEALVQNPNLYHSLMTYVQQALTGDTALSSYEKYVIDCVLASCENIKASLSEKDQETLEYLQKLSSQSEKTPFVYLKGQVMDRDSSEEDLPKEFTVLTLNTCFVPGSFPLLFGGVYLPWEERVSSLADKIRLLNADVVCLQEVHAEDACYALYEELKNEYQYFYAAIGPRVLGFSLETLGLPSGLFVASKYPIENPQFTLFSVSGFPMNYGFFDFVIKNKDTPIGHVYTTHMQSLDYDKFSEIRALQLQQIVEKMQEDLVGEDTKIPYFLCGDLNIPYGSGEPGEVLIRTHFYDDYNKNQTPVSESNRTCTDYFTNYFFAPDQSPENIDPNFQIIDYALLFTSMSIDQEYEMSTSLIPMNDLKEPKSAVTDHHALLTVIKGR
jgi:endonuclease/exonuclease/phosphatase family metal-dependent hydrolase